MSASELGREVALEFERMARTLGELDSLRQDIGRASPSTRDVAAAGLFLANFYNGVESILKRIARYHRVAIPAGEQWHTELARSFAEPPRKGLPALLDHDLAVRLTPFRKFRHVVFRGYGFLLRWRDMRPGIEQARGVFDGFQERVNHHLRSLRPPEQRSPQRKERSHGKSR